MYAKKLKRKCDVRGCRNTDVFAISRTRECGNSVIICKDCLAAALSAVSDYKNLPKPQRDSVAPPLFFNVDKLPAEETSVMEEKPEITEINTAAEEKKAKPKKRGAKDEK